MEFQPTRYGYALKIEPGEEIVGTLQRFAKERNLKSGLISGIGAVGETELGFFVRETRSYTTRTYPGEHEIGALTGNLSELDGEPFPHCHIVIAGEDMVAHTGHLFRGVVTVTCEIQIVTDPDVLKRIRRPDLGFNPLEPRA